MSPTVVYVSFQGNSGMAHYAEMLSQSMREHADTSLAMVGMQPDLAAQAFLPGFLPFPWSDNLNTRRLVQAYNPLFYRRIARRICTPSVPALVHITSQVTGLLSFVKEMHRLGTQVVYTVHDPAPHEEHRTPWGRVYERYQRAYQLPEVLRLCAAVHVHSEDHRALLCALYGEWLAVKTYVVPHGAGLARNVAEGTRQSVEISQMEGGDALTLLFFGRLEPYKGLDILLKAMKVLDERQQLVKLIVAGAGRLDDNPGVARNQNITLIHRFVPDDEVRHIFERADVVVLPYLTATQSGVIPMAYAFRKPVISTRVGALQDVVVHGKTGLLVKPGDPVALADAIEELVRNRIQLHEMSIGARNYLDEHLAWSKVAGAHFRQYEALLE